MSLSWKCSVLLRWISGHVKERRLLLGWEFPSPEFGMFIWLMCSFVVEGCEIHNSFKILYLFHWTVRKRSPIWFLTCKGLELRLRIYLWSALISISTAGTRAFGFFLVFRVRPRGGLHGGKQKFKSTKWIWVWRPLNLQQSLVLEEVNVFSYVLVELPRNLKGQD